MSLPPPAVGDVYEELAAADPAGRSAILRRLAAAGRLSLPPRDGRGAVLDGLDLGAEPPPLRQADLREAHLEAARLAGADLTGADLRGAVLRKADLRGAQLEGADLSGADLAGADLRGAQLGKARLVGCLLEEANLERAYLRHADLTEAVAELARLAHADLWGARLPRAILARATLEAAALHEADLTAADLTGVCLQRASLGQAVLAGANLAGADLTGADLGGADLRGAVLHDANLQGLLLTTCNLTGVHLSGAWLDRTRLTLEQLGGALGEERAGDPAAAAKGYLALERNFNSLGDGDDASWAYCRRRRMQKRAAWRGARAAWTAGRPGAVVARLARFASDQLVEWICDYGESVPRVLLCLLLIHVGFAVLYGATGSVYRVTEEAGRDVRRVTQSASDLATFSLMAMSTSGSPSAGLQPAGPLAHLVTGAQALLSIALTGLLGFVLGNRIRR